MAGDGQEQITQLLIRWAEGDRGALDLVTTLVYGEMRKIAEGYFRRERNLNTLQPTALVNETWLRLAKQSGLSFESRKQFFGLAAQVMRRVLVDYARGSRTDKRGGGERTLSLSDFEAGSAAELDDFLALDEALVRLAACSERQARVIELRYFGGLNVEEMAELLAVSPATVSRDQKMAEAWLSRAIESPLS